MPDSAFGSSANPTVLHSTVQCHVILYGTILYYTTLHYTTPHNTFSSAASSNCSFASGSWIHPGDQSRQ